MRIFASDLKTRLQIAKDVLKHKDFDGQVMNCGNCGSTYIDKVTHNENTLHYRARYICRNCGWHCVETQDWRE